LKSKNNELLGKLKETSGKLTQFETQFEGIDIDAVKGLLSRAGQDEETKLLTEGKVDEVFNRRTERLRGDYDKQLKTISERAEKAESFAAKFQGKVLGDSVRGAALKAGALPEATDDIILRAKGVFTLNEDGDGTAGRSALTGINVSGALSSKHSSAPMVGGRVRRTPACTRRTTRLQVSCVSTAHSVAT